MHLGHTALRAGWECGRNKKRLCWLVIGKKEAQKLRSWKEGY